MATKARTKVGYFIVTSFCRRGSHRARDIAHGSSDVEHVIEVENGSTLPYDVTAVTFDPAAPPQSAGGQVTIEFSRLGGSRATAWTADVPQLASGDSQKDFARIYCVVATAGGNARINSAEQQLRYRLDSSVSWQQDPTATGVLSLNMPIS